MTMPSLVGLLQTMQADMPRVQAEAKKRRNQPHHKTGLNRANHDDAGWMPANWIVPTQGTYCGGSAHLHEEPSAD
jgi:hypothetical protein